jgi:competence protein ComEC
MFWHGRPFLRILPFFVAGILVARQWFCILSQYFTLFFLVLLLLIAASAFVSKHIISFQRSWITGVILMTSVFVSGLSLTLHALKKYDSKLPTSRSVWMGKLLTEPVQRTKTVRFILKITRQIKEDSLVYENARIMTYLRTNTLPYKLHQGSRILFQGKLTPVQGPQNPGEFDYQRFLANKGIYYRTFIPQGSWKLLPASGKFSIPSLFGHARNHLLHVLHTHDLTREEYAVASAVLLGYDQLIDPDLHQNFTAAGAVHILCVSGMHVGILYLIFYYLLAFLLRFKRGELLRQALLLLIIWSYALLTGLSPSVSRAATMISLFILADMLRRDYDRFNVLAASAFLLLLFKPVMLFNVGFQLSYAAVSGILLFYFPLYRMFYFRHKILRIVWAAVAVSFSAQLGAFAVAAHYFHMFPLYFLLTNVAVFALSYLIIFSGLAYLLFAAIPVVNHLSALLLSQSTGLLIRIVRWVAALPSSVIYDLYFPWSKVILILGLILAFYYLILHKNIHLLTPILITVLLLLTLSTTRQIQLRQQYKMIIYSLRHHSAIDLIAGKEHILLTDSFALRHPSDLDYSLKNNRIALGLSENRHSFSQNIQTPFLFYRSGFGQIGSIRFYIPQNNLHFYPFLRKKIRVDYLICHSPGKIPLTEIAQAVRFRHVILDASLPYWALKKLINQSKQLHVNYINLRETGAYTINLRKK